MEKLSQVYCLKMGIFSETKMEELSACTITSRNLFESKSTTRPVVGGLLDSRMGSTSRTEKCPIPSCGQTDDKCPGHFGLFHLHAPVFHGNYILIVKKILSAFCYHCGSPLHSDKTLDEIAHISTPSIRFRSFMEKPKTKCQQDNCQLRQPAYKLDKKRLHLNQIFKAELGIENKIVLPVVCRQRFERISDAHVALMGLDPVHSRPERLIIPMLLVPPMCLRPTVVIGTRPQIDDLTHLLTDIIRANTKLAQEDPNHRYTVASSETFSMLQYSVFTYMNNSFAGVQRAVVEQSSKLLVSLTERFGKKEDRFRANLNGKRVDFCARIVITGDPKLGLDEVGVPLSIAKTVTVPVRVADYNIGLLPEAVQRGPLEYPSANKIVREDGSIVSISSRTNRRYLPKYLQLAIGNMVHCQLPNGYPVVFNRQPSLHKMSIMGH